VGGGESTKLAAPSSPYRDDCSIALPPTKNPGREAGVFDFQKMRCDQYFAITGELK
jgi:hypothetical protein